MLDMTTLMAVLALTTVTSVLGLLVASALNRQVVAIRFGRWGLLLSFVVRLYRQSGLIYRYGLVPSLLPKVILYCFGVRAVIA